MTLTASSVTTTHHAATVGSVLLTPSKGQGATRRVRKQQAPAPVDLRVTLRWTSSAVHRELGQLEPVPFWTGFCQLLRCHYLLWQTGNIAKPEITPTNLLYDDLPERKNAVLIDFDIAVNVDVAAAAPVTVGSEAEATPQSDCTVTSKEGSPKDVDAVESQQPAEKEKPPPPVQAFITTVADSTSKRTVPERMPGVIPYMPSEIIEVSPIKPVSRRYRHDLESFTWCLTWQCIKPHDRKSNLARYSRCFADTEMFRDYWKAGRHPFSTVPFDRARWGLRMEVWVKFLLVFWSETVRLGRHWKKLTDEDKNMKDPFAEIASGPLLGGSGGYKVWENEEEERKWFVERLTAILMQAGLPLGFEFADLDSPTATSSLHFVQVPGEA